MGKNCAIFPEGGLLCAGSVLSLLFNSELLKWVPFSKWRKRSRLYWGSYLVQVRITVKHAAKSCWPQSSSLQALLPSLSLRRVVRSTNLCQDSWGQGNLCLWLGAGLTHLSAVLCAACFDACQLPLGNKKGSSMQDINLWSGIQKLPWLSSHGQFSCQALPTSYLLVLWCFQAHLQLEWAAWT